MALPTLNSSTYTTVLPSTGKKVDFRPYLVKEEKILLVALESEDSNQIIQAMRDVIECCVQDVDTDDITSFDLEYLFLMLRSKSVGETIDLKMSCQNPKCESLVEISINVDEIACPTFDDSDRTIALTETAGVVLKFPSIKTIQALEDSASQIDMMLDMICECVVSVYDEDNVYDARDESNESISSFINSLNSVQFKMVTDFFENMPVLEHDVSHNCKNCDETNEINLKGLQSFFM